MNANSNFSSTFIISLSFAALFFTDVTFRGLILTNDLESILLFLIFVTTGIIAPLSTLARGSFTKLQMTVAFLPFVIVIANFLMLYEYVRFVTSDNSTILKLLLLYSFIMFVRTLWGWQNSGFAFFREYVEKQHPGIVCILSTIPIVVFFQTIHYFNFFGFSSWLIPLSLSLFTFNSINYLVKQTQQSSS